MKVSSILRKVAAAILVAAAIPSFAKGASAKTNDNDVVILYTNDVHCGISGKIGYAGLVAYRNEVLEKTPYVLTVDNGDAIQGEAMGSISKGSFIIDLMNEVKYDLAIVGNHEFDYTMPQLASLIKKAQFTYVNTNISYKGKDKTSFVDDTVPFVVKEFGAFKVGFIGLCTPTSITTSTPAYFMENDKVVYDFGAGKDGKKLYSLVQKTVKKCQKAGADFVVVLSHLGDNGVPDAVSSRALIQNTYGISAVLDGHSHSVIECEKIANKKGQEVLLSSTGTKFEKLGKLTISRDGKFSTVLVGEEFTGKDAGIEAYIEKIQSSYNEKLQEVVAKSDVALPIAGDDGIRLVRSRETAIGDLCADAYRAVAKSDVAFVNGGGIRKSLNAGNITFSDVIAVHPFGNMLTVVQATGAQILDCIEFAAHRVQNIASADGKAVGEFGGFMQVSGLKFKIDTSVPSSVETDEKNMFVKVGGKRRVSDVFVLSGNEWVPIDAAKTYTVASHNYMLLNSGDGHTMFKDSPVLVDSAMSDYQVLMTYMSEFLGGVVGSEYAAPQGRITIE